MYRVILPKRYRRLYVAPPAPRDTWRDDPSHFCDLSNPVRHLTYHICPFRNAVGTWQWNLEQLREHWHLFNGKKIIGINHDEDTVSPDEMLRHCRSLGMEWDEVVARPNSRSLGEVQTWIPTLELLNPESAQANEVVFSAHAKGVKYGEKMPPVIRDWTDIMYQVNLPDWDRVRDSLEWYISTGAFRARGARSWRWCRYGWYYSGAFWWWRLAPIGQRNWRMVGEIYPGREVWIGNVAERQETDCLFMDNTRSPYLPAYWQRTINKEWQEFQDAR